MERMSQVTDSRATPLTTMKWKGDLLQSGFIIAEVECGWGGSAMGASLGLHVELFLLPLTLLCPAAGTA